jgi:molybdenum cofactor biosynthesis enzyme MoaA
MPNQKIFCNVPWTNTHIYWDGSFGMCCSEKRKPHTDSTKYNLKNFTVIQWYTQAPMNSVRQLMHGDDKLASCAGCYHEEAHGYESRRIKENFKSVIFTEQAFERSYEQSPMYSAFEHSKETGVTDRRPIDWHVDLGNECNLACKMCNPNASSKISALFTKWQLIKSTANSNWTGDPTAWENFKASILETTNLNRIHFMGGEPLLSKRFPELLDFLLQNNKQNLSISFVSNGTIVDHKLIDKLKQFRSCDIEISLESIHDNNHYIRQGSNTEYVMQNIEWLSKQQTDTFHVVLRSVPQLFNVNNYDQYLRWAWEKKLPVQGIPLTDPAYMQISVLPVALRQKLVKQYQKLQEDLSSHITIQTITTGRIVSNLAQLIHRECDAVISMLTAPEPANVEELRKQLIEWMIRWDTEFKLDACKVFPEYAEFFKSYEYKIQY